MTNSKIPIEEWNKLNGFEDYYGYFVDLNGNPVERTPFSHPYSYDAYVVYKTDDFYKKDKWVYSDRMRQWDNEKFQRAFRAVRPNRAESQTFTGREPKDINRFLSLYFGKEVKLTAIQNACNVSTGYPYWIFAYREIEQLSPCTRG